MLTKLNTDGKAEVYIINGFLTDHECDRLIELIDADNEPSSVVSEDDTARAVTVHRTSSTSSLNVNNVPVANLENKILTAMMGKPWVEHSETPQGQRYLPGQYFRAHHDFFNRKQAKSYAIHTKGLGQRSWTFMVYLNEPEKGGQTTFPELGLSFTPKKGDAVVWNNLDENGVENPNTLHSGEPVEKGKKYIITKWFRKGPEGIAPQNTPVNQGQFTSKDDIPAFTDKGFMKTRIPEETWELIQDTYNLLRPRIRREQYDGMENQIYIKEQGSGGHAADIIPVFEFPSFTKLVHKQLQPVHEEWSGQELNPTYVYGIRSYRNGATLFPHVDRIQTHHISAILLVDQQVTEPWALDIKDHSGQWNKVYLEPGEMVLYESAKCEHGRLDALNGEFFRNFFVHYQLKNWTFKNQA